MSINSDIFTVLDIGTSKTVVLVAREIESMKVEILGVGVVSSRGIQAGCITNIESVTETVQEALKEAQLMSAQDITHAVMGVSGAHLSGDNIYSVVAISNKDMCVTKEDIYRVIQAAENKIQISESETILHVFSQSFTVDGQVGIKDPTGMVCYKLEALVHFIKGSQTYIKNSEKVVENAGLHVSGCVINALASSYAFLTEEMKDLGVGVIDIGAGVTDIILYVNGGVVYTGCIPIGGNHITHDISIILKIPLDSAEIIKKTYGSVSNHSVNDRATVEVPTIGNKIKKEIQTSELTEIIEARTKELLEMVDQEILKSGKKNFLTGGIILTGGCSLLSGLETLAEDILGIGVYNSDPSRDNIVAVSNNIYSPAFSTAVGLLFYILQNKNTDGSIVNTNQKKPVFKQFLNNIKLWMQKNL